MCDVFGYLIVLVACDSLRLIVVLWLVWLIVLVCVSVGLTLGCLDLVTVLVVVAVDLVLCCCGFVKLVLIC